jgi:hypothetical protein
MLSRSWRAILLCASIWLFGCDGGVKLGTFEKDRKAAVARTEEFRVLSDEHNFSRIYELGAQAMKAAVSKDQFVASAKASSAHFGKRKSSKLVASSCFPMEVRLVYHSEFENGVATEWLVWHVPKDEALLSMYRIAPGIEPFDKDKQVGCPS